MSCLETMQGKGLRLTPQRRLIVSIVHDAHSHLSAEEIIEGVQSRMPGVNKSTIYRTLDVLEGMGCVIKSESGDRFIYHHAEEGHHHHLVCTRCGRGTECSEGLFNEVERTLSREYRFAADFRHVVVNGICGSCWKPAE